MTQNHSGEGVVKHLYRKVAEVLENLVFAGILIGFYIGFIWVITPLVFLAVAGVFLFTMYSLRNKVSAGMSLSGIILFELSPPLSFLWGESTSMLLCLVGLVVWAGAVIVAYQGESRSSAVAS